MKNIMIMISAVGVLVGSIVAADVILPEQIVINNDDSKALDAKITEVTGKKAQDFKKGIKILSAKAEVACLELSDGQTSCRITIAK